MLRSFLVPATWCIVKEAHQVPPGSAWHHLQLHISEQGQLPMRTATGPTFRASKLVLCEVDGRRSLMVGQI
jgi:hypothetical protein